jgi:PTH1 family peptidyl-tRNA hydrolase
MKLIIGLGNPGAHYEKNRHNVGFMFLDFLAQGAPFVTDSMIHGEVVKIRTNTDEWILVKPQTFMNKSGEAVRQAVKKYFSADTLMTPANLIVVHDDLDIPFGKFKIQTQGPKLHNGLESIENHLHFKDFTRTRIGVDARSPENRMPGEAYVLQDFTTEELGSLSSVFEIIKVRFEAYVQSVLNCS